MNTLRNYFSIAILCFGLFTSYAQTEQDIVNEADRLQIGSRQEAINALASKGISLAQAKEMAQLRGIDFDTFLENYLKTNTASNANALGKVSAIEEVSSTVKIADVKAIEAASPKITTKEDVTNYFGYDIFINNPFVNISRISINLYTFVHEMHHVCNVF